MLPFDLTVHRLTWLYINHDLKRKKKHSHTHTHTHTSLQHRRKSRRKMFTVRSGCHGGRIWANRQKAPNAVYAIYIIHIVSSFVAKSFHRQIKMKSFKTRNEWEQQASKRTSDPQSESEGESQMWSWHIWDADFSFIIRQIRTSPAHKPTHTHTLMKLC